MCRSAYAWDSFAAVAARQIRDYGAAVFGVSPSELVVVCLVALIVVGPQQLPRMLRSLGAGLAKLRRITTDVRNQSGIDDILRAEGLSGGLDELRHLVRQNTSGVSRVASNLMQAAQRTGSPGPSSPSATPTFVPDRSREYPVEGPDAAGAIPEDLLPTASAAAAQSGVGSPSTRAATTSEGTTSEGTTSEGTTSDGLPTQARAAVREESRAFESPDPKPGPQTA